MQIQEQFFSLNIFRRRSMLGDKYGGDNTCIWYVEVWELKLYFYPSAGGWKNYSKKKVDENNLLLTWVSITYSIVVLKYYVSALKQRSQGKLPAAVPVYIRYIYGSTSINNSWQGRTDTLKTALVSMFSFAGHCCAPVGFCTVRVRS